MNALSEELTNQEIHSVVLECIEEDNLEINDVDGLIGEVRARFELHNDGDNGLAGLFQDDGRFKDLPLIEEANNDEARELRALVDADEKMINRRMRLKQSAKQVLHGAMYEEHARKNGLPSAKACRSTSDTPTSP